MRRRAFLRSVAAWSAAAAAPPWLDRLAAATRTNGPASALRRAPVLPGRRPPGPVRIRGRVRAAEAGLAGVGVTDGLQVVETDPDGAFELWSSTEREFVYLTVPSGHRIPTSPTGTARFYRPLTPGPDGEVDVAFELEPLPGSDERHVMLLLPDIQTEDATEVAWFHERTVPDVRETLRSLDDAEAFGVACGDIMFDNLELFPEYERGVEEMGIPFFQVVGNHDLDLEGRTDPASVATFQRRFGPGHYSFDRGAVHYVVLDDVFWHGSGYLGHLDAEQLAWLTADLARVEPGRTVLVALHIPVLGSRHVRDGRDRPGLGISVANRDALYELLDPFVAHIVCGHTHENEHVFEGGAHEHVCGTVSGAWWSGPICADGTPSGYGVYEVDGEDVRWRYKATGHSSGHQLRVYPRGADPSAPEEVVANVWDWDPEWTVVWYEDGERKGEMARRTGRDPLSRSLHEGPELPPRRKWVEPYPTRHLFYAPVSESAGEVRVEATDRFGRTYAASPGEGPT